jgi:2-polyprenyl-3-methyl-5-hydroxy-6-metoxy-1,4-benzoquinol methylase
MKPHEQAYYGYQTRARGLVTREALQQRFEKLKPWYAQRVGPFLPRSKDAACLDLPCGYGNFLYFLRAAGFAHAVGYDRDPQQVRLAQLLDLPAHDGEAFDVLGREGSRWDCISSIDFLEHLSRDQALAFLDLCRRRLAPGGVLIVRTPSADGPFGAHDRYADVTHQWAMTATVLRTVLEMAGFERVVILDERPQPYNAVNVVRLGVFHLARLAANGVCLALGLDPPALWSRSMWAVARTRPAGEAAS